MDEKLKRAIEEMAEGKEKGFNAVYSATYNHVYFRAKAYMKDEADAQDLTQIVYIEAYKNIKSLQNAESLFGWLDGICHNQGMKIFRKKKDVLPNVDEEGKDIFETLESNDIASLPELSTDQKETSRLIQGFIDELPEVQKAAVIAYYFDGFSVGEIAQMQDCSEGTVKSRLNYARKFLKDKVEGTEKRDGIRLHVVAFPTLYYAIKLMSENTKLSAKAAEGIYAGSCAEVGLTPGAITLGNAGAGVSAKMTVSGASKAAETLLGAGANAGVGASSGTGQGAAAGTGIAGATEAATAAGAGLSLGAKALLIAGAVLVGAGGGAGATYYAVSRNTSETVDVADIGNDAVPETGADVVEENDDSDINSDISSEEGEDETKAEETEEPGPSSDSVSDQSDDEGNNENSDGNTDVTLTEDEKTQIVDAIAYFSNYGLPSKDYVIEARRYAMLTLSSPDAEKGFPWKDSPKLDEEFIKDFYNSLGVSIPADYSFNDYGITPDSDSFLGEGTYDFVDYNSLEIENNGDGTYTLNGVYNTGCWDEEIEITGQVPFSATATKGGNTDIFGGLIIKDCSAFDYSKSDESDSVSLTDPKIMAANAAMVMNDHWSTGLKDAYVPSYYFCDITNDGIPELLYVEGTCEADFELYIYKWDPMSICWTYFGDAPGGHLDNLWVKNTHDGFYGDTVHMGYLAGFEYDPNTNATNWIYEAGPEQLLNEEGDYLDLLNFFNPSDGTLLEYYTDTSEEAVKAAIEVAK